MTRAELRVFLDKFYCGCGSPQMASAALLRVLDAYTGEDPKTGYKPAWTQDERWVPDEGMRYLFLYLLDSLGLLEHGSSINCSWLTSKGDEVRSALKTEESDDFAALHGDYCIHGVDVEDIGPGKHDCAKADADDRSVSEDK